MDLECPYCKKELDVYTDDGFSYEEDIKHEMECPYCKKRFIFTTLMSFEFVPEKADCLNDGKHDYQLTHTNPKEFSKMRCSMCDEERELTDNERIKYNIGTKQSYMDSLR